MIYVIATIEVKAGKREAFLAEFHKNMPNVHAEKGCLEYGPTVDATTEIKAQIPRRENVVTIVEKWESLQALNAHLVAPHMAVYRERVKDILVGVTLQILDPK
jgi:quinol monooxygenase YgiN